MDRLPEGVEILKALLFMCDEDLTAKGGVNPP